MSDRAVWVLVIIASGLLCDVDVAAARSYRVAPNPCPAPADVTQSVPERDATLNAAEIGAFLDAPLALDVRLPASIDGRLFKRLIIDPQTGALTGSQSARDRSCE